MKGDSAIQTECSLKANCACRWSGYGYSLRDVINILDSTLRQSKAAPLITEKSSRKPTSGYKICPSSGKDLVRFLFDARQDLDYFESRIRNPDDRRSSMSIKPGPKRTNEDGTPDKRQRVTPEKQKEYPDLKTHKHKKWG